MKHLIFMTFPKYIISFFFVVCGLSASCADSNVSANTPITRETVLPISALNFRDELAKQMTPEQIADAQKRTEKFWSDMKK